MDWQITRFTRLDPCSLYRFRFWFRSQYHCTTSNPHSTNPHANFHIFHPISSLVTSFWNKKYIFEKTSCNPPTLSYHIWHHHLYAIDRRNFQTCLPVASLRWERGHWWEQTQDVPAVWPKCGGVQCLRVTGGKGMTGSLKSVGFLVVTW